MNKLRWSLTISMFVVGTVTGLLANTMVTPQFPDNPYQQLEKTSEPAPAAAVVSAVGSGDARGLAKLLDQDVLKQLGQALSPLQEVYETQFVGAVERNGDVLSAYVATGKEAQGTKIVRGFVLRVQGEKVVGVN